MAGTTIIVTLMYGLKIGDETHYQVVLREATAGDVLDAQEAGERLVFAPTGDGGVEPVLVASPSRVGIEVLRRQIASVGDISGPLDLALMRRLDPEDLNFLLIKSGQLDGAAVSQAQDGASKRGRDDGDRPDAAQGTVGGRDVDGVE